MSENVELLRQLEAELEAATVRVSCLQESIDAVRKTIALHQARRNEQSPTGSGNPPRSGLAEEYLGLSQPQAIIKFAESNGGVLTVYGAGQMLAEAGLTTSRRPYSVANSIILRRKDLFRWTDTGTYQLLRGSPDEEMEDPTNLDVEEQPPPVEESSAEIESSDEER